MKIQKILLICPYIEQKKISDKRLQYNFIKPRFPLGIGYLAAYLIKKGYEVDILDMLAQKSEVIDMGDRVRMGLSDEEIRVKIECSGADLIGISQMFSYLTSICHNILSIIKKINHNIITVWGGTHPTVMPEECLSNPNVDYIVLGEGERPLYELIERINSGQNIMGLNSIGYRDENNNLVISKQRSWIENLDNHVLPAREKLDMERYTDCDFNLRMFTMVTSRGCPFNCTFCTSPTFYQNHFCARTPENVVAEMKMLVEKYGAELIVVDDENLTYDMKRIEMIMDVMMERGVKIKWYAEAGLSISKLNWNIISKMKQTGFLELRLAVESGDVQTLRAIKKPLAVNQVKQVVKWARQVNIRVVSFLLIGLPGETKEQMQRTINFANEIGFDWNIISMVLPLPGTQIYRDLSSKQFEIRLDDLERYTLPVNGVSKILSEELVAFREAANNYLNFENNFNLTRGNPRLAIKDFTRLLQRYPNLEKIWYYLGIANYKVGDIPKAVEAFDHAYKLNSNYKNVSDWLNKLKYFNQIGCKNIPYLPYESEELLDYKYGHMEGVV